MTKIKKFKEAMDYANSQLKVGNHSVAEEAFRRAIEIKETDSEAWRGLSVSLMNQRKYNDGIDALRKSKTLK